MAETPSHPNKRDFSSMSNQDLFTQNMSRRASDDSRSPKRRATNISFEKSPTSLCGSDQESLKIKEFLVRVRQLAQTRHSFAVAAGRMVCRNEQNAYAQEKEYCLNIAKQVEKFRDETVAAANKFLQETEEIEDLLLRSKHKWKVAIENVADVGLIEEKEKQSMLIGFRSISYDASLGCDQVLRHMNRSIHIAASLQLQMKHRVRHIEQMENIERCLAPGENGDAESL